MSSLVFDTEALGVYPSDVIVRTALGLALQDLRAHPWLLNYAFQGLAHDDQTKDRYGAKEIEAAKSWFLKTKVTFGSTLTFEAAKFPHLSIDLLSSSEQPQEGTLGDTHYVPYEPAQGEWPPLAGPLTPTAYDRATGTVTVALADLNGLVLAPGMVFVSRTGAKYQIVDVTDDNVFQIAAGTVDEFTSASIRSADPAAVVAVESAVFQEQVAVGCHVDSEPVHLIYLHSVVVFALRRYAKSLLEGRGFERSVIASTNLRRDLDTLPEHVFSRYVQLTGYCRQAWPQTPLMTVQSSTGMLSASPAGATAPVVQIPEDDDEPGNPFSY